MLKKISELVRSAGLTIREASPQTMDTKKKSGFRDVFTKYDVSVQETLFKGLGEIMPEAGFIGEEGGGDKAGAASGYNFVVDPIDGTANFVFGCKHSCISVGLIRDGKPYAGVVYQPYLDELFCAQEGKGAFLNGARIYAAEGSMKENLSAFGTSPYVPELTDKTFEITKKVFLNSMDIRRSGSAALDICYSACGRFGLFFEMSLYPWDYAAGAAIISEAGGKICDMDGRKLTFDKRSSVVSGGKACVEEFLKMK